MTREERIEKLRHLIICMKCEVSGRPCDNNCPTQYDAGHMGEIIENLEEIAKALEQEPCEDCISRDELLKAIDTWDKFGCDADTKLVPYQDHYIPYIHYDDVVKCIKGMPPVTPQPKTKWVLVSKKLPKEDGEYLLFGKIYEYEENYYIFIGEYDSCAEQFGIWQEQFDRKTLGCLGSEFFEYSSVIAWMPLPQPYKPESEEV